MTLYPPASHTLVTTSLISVISTILVSTYESEHTVFVFLCLTYKNNIDFKTPGFEVVFQDLDLNLGLSGSLWDPWKILPSVGSVFSDLSWFQTLS